MRSRRRSGPASGPPRSAAPASSSASAPSAKAHAKHLAQAPKSIVSAAEAAHRPDHRGRAAALWLGFIILIAAGIALAWVGAGSLRPIVTSSGLQFRTIHAGKGDPIRKSHEPLP